MMMYHVLRAFEVDAERQRADRSSRRRWKDAFERSDEAWTDVPTGNRVRANLAMPLVALSRFTRSVSERACSLATRIEGDRIGSDPGLA